MSNIDLVVADQVDVVESIEQITLPYAEAITLGSAARIVPSSTGAGKFTNGKATDSTEANIYGLAIGRRSGSGMTVLRKGVIGGLDLSGLAYFAKVYLSDTDGRLSTTAGTTSVLIGHVIPAWGQTLGNGADKLLAVDVQNTISVDVANLNATGVNTIPTAGTLVVTDADSATVGGVIVPQHIEVSARFGAAATWVDSAFFIANRAYQVVAVKEVHATAESTATNLRVQLTKDTGTDAPGAGNNLLTNNTNAGFNLKATANTVQTGTLTATTADLQLAAGDRLSLDFEAAATEGANVLVTVSLKRI